MGSAMARIAQVCYGEFLGTVAGRGTTLLIVRELRARRDVPRTHADANNTFVTASRRPARPFLVVT